MSLTSEKELVALEEMNIELLETVILAGQKLLSFADQNNVPFPERETLAHLLSRSASVLNQLRNFDKRPRDKLPMYWWGGWCNYVEHTLL